ncbi:MAG: hypothetical protein ACPGVA_05750 [Pikeienuella sp.]
MKRALTASVLAVTSVCMLDAASAQEKLLTSNGFEISTPRPEALSCDQLSDQLSSIDETGYRLGGPEPANEADGAVYDYELKLSVEFFWRCATRVDGQAQSDAFRSGFSEPKTQ